MSRAKELFSRLQGGDVSALDQLIADREPESLFLDFKRSPADGAGVQLAPDDNNNLSKAVSGFGNSEGGLLIWGVDCRRDSSTRNEVASKHALVDANGFRTKIEGAISRGTLPPHQGVQTCAILDSSAGASGYVAVFIPKAQQGPLRSVVTKHYHFRSGSNFEIVPHDVLAGMFGRSPQPRIAVNFVSHPARLDESRQRLVLAMGIIAANVGGVLAERPYLSVWYGDLNRDWLTAQCPNEKEYVLRQALLPGFSVVGRAGVVIPPGASEHLCDLILQVPLNYEGSIQMDCKLGVHGAPPESFSLKATPDAIAAMVHQVRENPGGLQSSAVLAPNTEL